MKWRIDNMYDNHVFYLYLPKTREYIVETNDENIWIKSTNPNERFEDSNIQFMCELARKIASEKHLMLNEDLVLESEYFILKRERHTV
jgi:hypothetical protein